MQRWGGYKAFRMYGGIGMSASSLHRESTDSLIHTIQEISQLCFPLCIFMPMFSSCPVFDMTQYYCIHESGTLLLVNCCDYNTQISGIEKRILVYKTKACN